MYKVCCILILHFSSSARPLVGKLKIFILLKKHTDLAHAKNMHICHTNVRLHCDKHYECTENSLS